MPRSASPGGTGKYPRLSRRGLLGFGGLGALGFAPLSPPASGAAAPAPGGPAFGAARSVIFISLYGGPSHVDMWDLKPDAPAEVRGPFRPIRTRVPGLEICEHLPRLAGLADRYTLIRSVSHGDGGHRSAAYTSFTGW